MANEYTAESFSVVSNDRAQNTRTIQIVLFIYKLVYGKISFEFFFIILILGG